MSHVSYDARIRAARLARVCWQDGELADRLELEAASLKERFDRDFWLEERGHYALALDRDKVRVDALTSNVGHLLWSGIVPTSHAAAVRDRLMAADMFSGWGIRTMSSRDAGYKPIEYQIRIAAEDEERQSYEDGRMPADWLTALAPLGTDWRTPFLEAAPWIVALFEQLHGRFPDGSNRKHYYARESVGIACGLFVAAVHQMGLVTLAHTPSPMRFLSTILSRPKHERPFVLLPVGYRAADCVVRDLRRKSLDEVASFVE